MGLDSYENSLRPQVPPLKTKGFWVRSVKRRVAANFHLWGWPAPLVMVVSFCKIAFCGQKSEAGSGKSRLNVHLHS